MTGQKKLLSPLHIRESQKRGVSEPFGEVKSILKCSQRRCGRRQIRIRGGKRRGSRRKQSHILQREHNNGGGRGKGIEKGLGFRGAQFGQSNPVVQNENGAEKKVGNDQSEELEIRSSAMKKAEWGAGRKRGGGEASEKVNKIEGKISAWGRCHE